MTRFCFVMAALCASALIPSAHAQRERRAAPSTAPSSSDIPAHNLGAMLASTALYDLYEYRSYKGWCTDGHAALSILYKVQPDFVIDQSDESTNRFTRDIFPVVRARCPTVRQIAVFNYVKGVIIDSSGKEYGYQDAA